MSATCQPKDGLLLLLHAAKKLDENASQRVYCSESWEPKSIHKSSYDHKYALHNSYSYTVNKRPVTTTRCTHNELEKSRRAHLRACMEALKEHLNFDNDVPRITMLTVLKKATATIQSLRQKNQYLETYEDKEKQRCAQLIKRRQLLKKKLEEKRNRSLKLQNWRERNRNSSECSINTTSSDDSEMDQQLRPGTRTELTASYGSPSPSQHIATPLIRTESTILSTAYTFKRTTHSGPTFRPPSGLDVFDTSSSDSGYEEATIRLSGAVSPDESTVVCCTTDGSQFTSAYVNKNYRAH
ncbi:MAX dimerization protein [Paragonimus westermani]|uniref:MAX dimerization protein n=1 Tax=Paragonimus westermani TaxID=34504 RepID=A0A5J4NUA1_9TREM|nr:MAX dimerization protein [Paragonimus westermani]